MIERSPHLEAVRARGYEVLDLIEPVDELLVQALLEFEGRALRSVAKGEIALGDAEEREALACEQQSARDRFSALLRISRSDSEQQVRDVRLSGRLTTSPVCLTGGDADFSPHIERLLVKGAAGMPRRRRSSI
jgi:molecular chaperone HtpG